MSTLRAIRRTGRRVALRVEDRFVREPATRPVFVLGNQKSGTTAIARLLSAASGSSYSHDMFFRRGWDDVDALHDGRLGVPDLVRRGPAEFTRGVIKDPDLTFHAGALADAFPQARFLVVVRDPARTVKSILERLAIPGDLDDLPPHTLAGNPLWASVFAAGPLGLPGGSHIDVLAQRWTRSVACREELSALGREPVTVRYEDFLADKAGVLGDLCARLDLPAAVDVSALLDRQFQPRGTSRPVEEFFGAANLERIRRWTADAGNALGYPR